MKKMLIYNALQGLLLLSSCQSGYTLVSVEGERVALTDKYEKTKDASAAAILAPYQKQVDELMKPVIGHAAHRLEVYRPESPLSNLIADILRESGKVYTGKDVQVGVMNMGGIRNILNEGDITFGSIYEISPFENSLVVVTMTGDVLLELFEQIARVHGEGISGACLEISKDGKLLSAKVNGEEIDEQQEYRVATIDYLAEGNDHLSAFRKAQDKVAPEGALLRKVFIDYVERCEAEGHRVNAKVEGRIVELENE